MTAPAPIAVRKKDLNWLRHISRGLSTMYPGQPYEHVPEPVVYRLRNLGLVEEFVPPNPAHKIRIVLTDAGSLFLSNHLAEDAA